jgi:hypothetical protein
MMMGKVRPDALTPALSHREREKRIPSPRCEIGEDNPSPLCEKREKNLFAAL